MGRVETIHYPASKVPSDLRSGISPSATVSVVVEVEGAQSVVRSARQWRDLLAKASASATPTTTDEAVARIRALRDEWDD